MIKKSFLLLLSVLPLFLQAQSKLPDNMFLNTLPNGLQVLVIEDNSVPLATVMITCKNGAFTETPEFNGLSHLYEHMFFKANKDYRTVDDFLGRVSELGMRFNGSTTFEEVNYYFTLPDYNLKDGLRFMNSAIRYPRFDPKDMEHENQVVDGEFQRDESNPGFVLHNAMEHHMWGDLYSRKNAIGNHQVIRTATPAMMDSIKNKYYYPNNSLLTVAGNVDHEVVFKDVEKIYGSWKASEFDPFQKWPIPEFKPLEKTDYFIVESSLAKQPQILVEWHGPDTHNDVNATYAADVFSDIVNQSSSTLKKAMMQSGLALQMNVNYLTLGHVGPISFTITPNPGKIKECMEELRRQIALMDNDDYFTEDQLQTAQRKLEITKIREQEVTTDFVETTSFWWASASLDYFTTYTDNMMKITRADLKDYVRKYIKDKPYCAGLLISPELNAQVNPRDFFTSSN